jgi:hypothetical protein
VPGRCLTTPKSKAIDLLLVGCLVCATGCAWLEQIQSAGVAHPCGSRKRMNWEKLG